MAGSIVVHTSRPRSGSPAYTSIATIATITTS